MRQTAWHPCVRAHAKRGGARIQKRALRSSELIWNRVLQEHRVEVDSSRAPSEPACRDGLLGACVCVWRRVLVISVYDGLRLTPTQPTTLPCAVLAWNILRARSYNAIYACPVGIRRHKGQEGHRGEPLPRVHLVSIRPSLPPCGGVLSRRRRLSPSLSPKLKHVRTLLADAANDSDPEGADHAARDNVLRQRPEHIHAGSLLQRARLLPAFPETLSLRPTDRSARRC